MKKIKKSLAVLLAVLMLASFTPLFASAATQIALKATHVTEWPTATGSMYVGQIIGEHITLSGGKVVYEGVEVPGHFEHADPEYLVTPSDGADDNWAADIKFVPDDTTAYKGFTKYYSKTTFPVYNTTPVFVDEVNDPLVATAVDKGATLASSTLSGGQMKNPYYPEEPKILAKTWAWSDSTVVVEESGYYEAKLSVPGGYATQYHQVWVEAIGAQQSTETIEAPTLKNVEAGSLWKNVAIEGGKAVVKGGTEEVAGTYSITKINQVSNLGDLSITIGPGYYEIELTFTPDNTESYLPSTTIVTITVDQIPIKFVDDNGNEIVPEIRVPYGTKLDNGNFLPKYIKAIKTNYDGNLSYRLDESIENTLPAVGTYEYNVTLSTYKTVGVTPTYADTTLTFKLIIEPVTVEMKADWVIVTSEELAQNERYYRFVRADGENTEPRGTYDVYVDGELIADDVKTFKWLPTTSKDYEFRVVYNPIENDPFTVNEWTQTVSVSMRRNIRYETDSYINSPFTAFAGAEVKVYWSGAFDDFESWVITDSQGNPVELEVKTLKYITDENGSIIGDEIVDGDYTSTNIIFTMPDYDITITTKDSAPETGSGESSLWSFWQKLVDWLVSLYRMIVDFLIPTAEAL